jgi:hypothetical protein
VGTTNDRHPAVSTYHRLLVWDIEKAPRVTRYADRVLNPLVGKSLVVYFSKPGGDQDRPSVVRAVPDAGPIDREGSPSREEALA